MNASRVRRRLTVAIPAKNEASAIGNALRAFVDQRDLQGRPLDPRLFEVLVLANDCDDDTERVVRDFAARHPAHAIVAVSRRLPCGSAHVGEARRLALELALERQLAHGEKNGYVGSTDADSAVCPTWVAHTLDHMQSVDAVAGFVEISDVERETMQAPLRLLYDRERAFRRAIGEVEARFDPRPYDPPSRHDSFVGTSFAVRVATYLAVGGVPPLPRLEDVAFAQRLRRIDARIRHSYDVRVATSGRIDARVQGGFGSFIGVLRERGARHESFCVESGTRLVLRAKARGLLRAVWQRPEDARVLESAANLYAMSPRAIYRALDPFAPFGETLDRIEAVGIPFESLPDEPVERSLETLRDAIASATPASATRINAASGAG